MAFLTGLLDAYGGFGQGQQAKRDYELRKQQGDQAAQQAAEQRKIDDLNIAHAQTVADQDKTTTTFRSKLQLPPGNVWASYSGDQKAAYLERRKTAAIAAGDMDTANSTQQEIDNIALSAQRNAMVGLDAARGAQAYSQADYNQARAKAAGTAQQTAIQIAGMNNRTKMLTNAATVQGRGLVAQYNGQARYAVAQLAGAYMVQGHDIASATQMAIKTYDNQYKGYLAATSPNAQILDPAGAAAAVAPTMQPINIYTGGNGPAPTINAADWLTGGTAAAGGSGAAATQHHVAQKPATAQWSPQQLQTLVTRLRSVGQAEATSQMAAGVRAGRIDPATASQALRMAGFVQPLPVGGGSQGTSPFERVRYNSPVMQQDMPHTSPSMQTAFYGMLQFSPTVTSVMHGTHEGATSGPDEDPHYAGRAVDVGAFGGVPVGLNQQTVAALAYAISSGRFSRIGAWPPLANNPKIIAFARAHGVVIFPDPGSGPHIHLEVAG